MNMVISTLADVYRRIGGLELHSETGGLLRRVYRRIGGLESRKNNLHRDFSVYRRIGGLEFHYIKKAALIQPFLCIHDVHGNNIVY